MADLIGTTGKGYLAITFDELDVIKAQAKAEGYLEGFMAGKAEMRQQIADKINAVIRKHGLDELLD